MLRPGLRAAEMLAVPTTLLRRRRHLMTRVEVYTDNIGGLQMNEISPRGVRHRWPRRCCRRASRRIACRRSGTAQRRRCRAMTRPRAGYSIDAWSSYSRDSAVTRRWSRPRQLRPRPRRRSAQRRPGRAPSPGRRRQQGSQAGDGARLDLADALGGDAVLVGQLVQRGLVLAHPAPLQDRAAAIVEPLERRRELIGGRAVPLLALDLLGRICIGRRQVGRRTVGFPLPRPRRC